MDSVNIGLRCCGNGSSKIGYYSMYSGHGRRERGSPRISAFVRENTGVITSALRCLSI